MKHLALILTALFLVSCTAIPSSPKVSFGKKCVVTGDKVTYSYIWIYDKNEGLPADEVACDLLEGK